MFAIAEIVPSDVNTQGAIDWLTQDPTGKKVALAGIVVLSLILLFFVVKSVRWLAARWKTIMVAAVVIGGCYYGAMTIFDLGPVAWAVAGMVAFGALVGFALIVSRS